MSNGKMNEYLKAVGFLCGFDTPFTQYYTEAGKQIERVGEKWQFLTTHAGRKSFICYAAAEGATLTEIARITGHSDIKEMQPYLDITDEAKAEVAAKFDTFAKG